MTDYEHNARISGVEAKDVDVINKVLIRLYIAEGKQIPGGRHAEYCWLFGLPPADIEAYNKIVSDKHTASLSNDNEDSGK